MSQDIVKSILIVDDEEEVAGTLCSHLAGPNRMIELADSGYSAIDKIQTGSYDLIITDYHMKQGDGISLSHYCSNVGVPCIVITGYNSDAVEPYLPDGVEIFDKIDCFQSNDFVAHVEKKLEEAKPVSATELKLRVLVLDDDEVDFLAVKRLLLSVEQPVYEVHFSDDVESAIGSMSSNAHDAYILDYRIGPESGIDILKKAKQNGCNKPILILSGIASRQDQVDQHAIRSGADDFLDKDSLTGERIDRAIRYAMERKRQACQVTEQQPTLSQALKQSTVGEMLGKIFHEIKNPLAIISGRAQLMAIKLTDPNYSSEMLAKDIQSIEKAVLRASKIMTDFQSSSGDSTKD